MGMTAEEMGRMTLADLEAMAERFGAAVKTIRDAQALLGGGHMRSPEGFVPVQIDGVTHAVPQAPRAAPVVFFSPSEQAERAKLLQQFKPEDVEAMERP